MDEEIIVLGPEEMSMLVGCWKCPTGVERENIWGPFGETSWSFQGRGTGKRNTDHHRSIFFSDQSNFYQPCACAIRKKEE